MICAEPSHQRISFSSDLGQSDITPLEPPTPVRRDTTLLDSSNSDFEFHISRNFDHESSPADEIFANGMILPILPFQVTSTVPKRLYKYELPPIVSVPLSLSPSPSPSPCPPPPPLPENPRKHSEKEASGGSNWESSEAEKASSSVSKSFWSFKRSSSLNCDIKRSLICSFPRLTRSNSTGSVTNSKRAMLRDVNKHSSQRSATTTTTNPHPQIPSSPSSSSICCSVYQFRQHKNGGGFRVSPVISVPSPFGLGSFLRHSRDKNKQQNKNKKKKKNN